MKRLLHAWVGSSPGEAQVGWLQGQSGQAECVGWQLQQVSQLQGRSAAHAQWVGLLQQLMLLDAEEMHHVVEKVLKPLLLLLALKLLLLLHAWAATGTLVQQVGGWLGIGGHVLGIQQPQRQASEWAAQIRWVWVGTGQDG